MCAVHLKNEERQVCEVWTRVMGYFRPVNHFNKGKQSEYAERVCFSEHKAVHAFKITPKKVA